MFSSLPHTLYAKWREDRNRKGSYEYTSVDMDSWRFALVKGDQEDYYHFIVFIRHPDDPICIEGELSEDEQVMKQIMDDLTRSEWTMVGMEVVNRPEDVNPSALILARLDISPL